MASRAASKSHKLQSFTGLLQPVSEDESEVGSFKFVTPEKVYFLTVPDSLVPYLRHHLWEDFNIEAEVVGKENLSVKKARMQSEDRDEIRDEDSGMEMGLIEHQLHQGQHIESRE